MLFLPARSLIALIAPFAQQFVTRKSENAKKEVVIHKWRFCYPPSDDGKHVQLQLML